jgi:DNA repair photolyase
MKQFKGKALYNPSGKAGEYSYWACNFFTGCSNDCQYCYCKRGVLAHTWSNTPQLKKCFKDKDHALEVFDKEMLANLPELREHGIFFSFTTDPMLPETMPLTLLAANEAAGSGVPVKILTKRADWVDKFLRDVPFWRERYAFGFTLTGHDELEPNASTNAERIEAMRKLHDAGFKTFASIEPVIIFEQSRVLIRRALLYCDLFKIGLMSGKKYTPREVKLFVDLVLIYTRDTPVYFKDGLLSQAGIDRRDLPPNCVTRNYNIFIGGEI